MDPSGATTAAVVIEPQPTSLGHDVMIRAEVVALAWRKQGVGTVTLGLLGQMLSINGAEASASASIKYGNCKPAAARYYQRAGFSVLQPGEVLPMPDGRQLGLNNQDYPCWFSRPY